VLPTTNRGSSLNQSLSFVIVLDLYACSANSVNKFWRPVNRSDLSKPPSDDELLSRVIDEVLAQAAVGSVVEISALERDIAPQVPDTIPREKLVLAIGRSAVMAGLVLDFDSR